LRLSVGFSPFFGVRLGFCPPSCVLVGTDVAVATCEVAGVSSFCGWVSSPVSVCASGTSGSTRFRLRLWTTRLETVAACSFVILSAQAARARRFYCMFLLVFALLLHQRLSRPASSMAVQSILKSKHCCQEDCPCSFFASSPFPIPGSMTTDFKSTRLATRDHVTSYRIDPNVANCFRCNEFSPPQTGQLIAHANLLCPGEAFRAATRIIHPSPPPLQIIWSTRYSQQQTKIYYHRPRIPDLESLLAQLSSLSATTLDILQLAFEDITLGPHKYL
jgi:hypothetical protein